MKITKNSFCFGLKNPKNGMFDTYYISGKSFSQMVTFDETNFLEIELLSIMKARFGQKKCKDYEEIVKSLENTIKIIKGEKNNGSSY